MVQAAHDLNEANLVAFLEQNIDGFQGPVEIEKFPGGQSNPTYLLSAASGKYVLRRKPFGKLLPSAHAVDREFRLINGLQNTGVPTPRAYLLCEDDNVIGSMFYVMSYVPGRIFWDSRLTELPVAERSAVLLELVRILAEIHNVDVAEAGLQDFGNAGDYFGRQLSRWTKQYRGAETENRPEMESLINWLEQNLPEDDGSVSIVHGDYRLDNIIFDATEPRGVAVLDWELSTLGHPLADLAYLCACLRLPDMGPIKGLMGVDRAAEGLPSEEEITQLYCDLRGLERIDNWTFYLAFSLFRLGAITQGVYKRSLDGNASNTQASMAGKAVDVFAKIANSVIQEG